MNLDKANKSNYNRRRGFTLIEILITLAIIGILSSIATVSYRLQLPRIRANAAARQVWGDLHRARSLATKSAGKHVVVMFAPDGPTTNANSYSILFDTKNDLGATGVLVLDQSNPDRDVYVLKNVPLPGGVVFVHGGSLPKGADYEPIGNGITFQNRRVFFQSSGRATVDNEPTADSLLPAEDYRAVYIISEEHLAERNYRYMYGILIDGISGLPKTLQYNPDGNKWQE